MAVLSVTLSPDRQQVIMSKRSWRQDIARAALPHWIALYRQLATREGGRFARFYAHDLAALEAFERELDHG